MDDFPIYTVRGQKVMLDEDLARVYGVETRILNQSINRNRKRFPIDFMFQLTTREYRNLTSQIVISRWGGRRQKPFVFTEHGAVMLASILRSDRAVQMSIEVLRAFIRLRRVLSSQKDLERQLIEIRTYVLKRINQVDQELKKVWRVLDGLTEDTSAQKKPGIGFKAQ